MKIKPMLNRVLLEAIDFTGDSPIVLPDNLQVENFNLWKVLAVGDPRILEKGERIPIELKVGDIVMITPRFMVTMRTGDKIQGICDYAGVIGKVEYEPGETPSRIIMDTSYSH